MSLARNGAFRFYDESDGNIHIAETALGPRANRLGNLEVCRLQLWTARLSSRSAPGQTITSTQPPLLVFAPLLQIVHHFSVDLRRGAPLAARTGKDIAPSPHPSRADRRF